MSSAACGLSSQSTTPAVGVAFIGALTNYLTMDGYGFLAVVED